MPGDGAYRSRQKESKAEHSCLFESFRRHKAPRGTLPAGLRPRAVVCFRRNCCLGLRANCADAGSRSLFGACHSSLSPPQQADQAQEEMPEGHYEDPVHGIQKEENSRAPRCQYPRSRTDIIDTCEVPEEDLRGSNVIRVRPVKKKRQRLQKDHSRKAAALAEKCRLLSFGRCKVSPACLRIAFYCQDEQDREQEVPAPLGEQPRTICVVIRHEPVQINIRDRITEQRRCPVDRHPVHFLYHVYSPSFSSGTYSKISPG